MSRSQFERHQGHAPWVRASHSPFETCKVAGSSPADGANFMKLKLTEKMIQNQILGYLRAIGVYCWKHWQGPMSPIKGIADIIGITREGRFIAIEVKGERGKVTPEQQHFLDIIASYNGIALLVRSVDEVMEKIKIEKKEEKPNGSK